MKRLLLLAIALFMSCIAQAATVTVWNNTATPLLVELQNCTLSTCYTSFYQTIAANSVFLIPGTEMTGLVTAVYDVNHKELAYFGDNTRSYCGGFRPNPYNDYTLMLSLRPDDVVTCIAEVGGAK